MKGLMTIGMKRIGTTSIGIDIGKKKCVACIMNEKDVILERIAYDNFVSQFTYFALTINLVREQRQVPRKSYSL